MPESTTRPKNIQVRKGEGLLVIDWQDGTHCEYPLTGLRAACPCASCRGGHENMGGPGSPDMLELDVPIIDSRATQLVDAQLVGNYALQLVWKDGHRFGIYRWDYLRELCPEGSDG